ncbi:helix-turn-helix domain-containing protein [Tunturiibacter gelidoferens]|uniref:DNA-binding transcriptional regulator AlpA n=1 Tax=Tunturiibacter gelidiferens TaxID=3069689 RepID=A0A9X0U4G9_9BACT|nr:helix-turn-helix domain-containing protein [Edaphobacter lichenicola]MBB5329451.1 putative DNA-binding transcriptional regulator AlpA [Edaphobacter lichenicola]
MSKITPFCRTFPDASDHHAPCSVATTIERHRGMLTAKQLAPLLGESVKTLYNRVKRGGQPAVLIGGAVKFDPYETAAWLRSRSA